MSYIGTNGQQGGNHWQGGATAPSTGVHADDGSVFTGYYPNLNSLSKDEKRIIHEERKRKGTDKGKKGKYPSRAVKQVETTENLKAKLKKLQLKMSALKRKPDDSSEDSDSVKDNAGESFGGQKEKKKSKSSWWIYFLWFWIVAKQWLLHFIKDRGRERRRRICDITTTARRSTRNIAGTQTIADAATVHHGRIELDSHGDTTVFGKNFVLLSYTVRECDVEPYTDTYDAIKNIPIVSAATGWTSLESTETYILVFNEGLWMQGEMDHSLINLNQMRHNSATVQDNPFSPSPLFIETAEADFVLPLEISGTNILARLLTVS